MKITNRMLVESTPLIADVSRKQLPVKVSYTISRNMDKIDEALKPYNTERRKLLEKYGEKDKTGKLAEKDNTIQLDKSRIGDFKKDIDTLLDIEINLDIRKFKLADIGDVNFSAAELRAIGFMIDD